LRLVVLPVHESCQIPDRIPNSAGNLIRDLFVYSSLTSESWMCPIFSCLVRK
jgi:hypothetical protein